MKIDLESDKIVVYLEGKIDSANTGAIDKELNALMDKNPGLPLVIDASALQYISSAGLRVLIQLYNRQEQKLEVQNASPMGVKSWAAERLVRCIASTRTPL